MSLYLPERNKSVGHEQNFCCAACSFLLMMSPTRLAPLSRPLSPGNSVCLQLFLLTPFPEVGDDNGWGPDGTSLYALLPDQKETATSQSWPRKLLLRKPIGSAYWSKMSPSLRCEYVVLLGLPLDQKINSPMASRKNIRKGKRRIGVMLVFS